MGVRRGVSGSMGLAVVLAVCFVAALASSSFSGVSAAVINLTPSSNWKANLTYTGHPAGTIINLAAGTYSHSGRLGLTLKGKLAAPIIIQGPSAGNAVIVQTNPSGANAMEVDGSNFVLRNFKLQGGSLGLRLGVASNITNVVINNLEIFQTQGTALTLNTADSNYLRLHKNVTVKNCYFRQTNYGVPAGSQTGECLYFGTDPVCTGTCPDCTCTVKKVYVKDSLIKNNLCWDTLNSKPGWGSGFQIKGGSNGISIVDNVCYQTKGPCILTYATSYPGSFTGAVNRVARNLAWGSYDIAIQTTQGHVITDNIILGSNHPYGIGIIPNKGTPSNVKIVGNTIFGGSVSSIYASGLSKATNGSIVIANNAIFATAAGFKLTDAVAIVNAKVLAKQNAVNGVKGFSFPDTAAFSIPEASNQLVNVTAYNFRPKSSSKLLNKATADATAVDFDCNPRPTNATKSVGALQFFDPVKRGWTILPNKKKASPNCANVK